MTIKELESLWDRFEGSSAAEMSFKCAEFELSLKKAAPKGAAPAEPTLASSIGSHAKPAEQPLAEEYLVIQAPLAGTFYRAPSPEAESFVKVGSRVEKDQVVCIIEAMKMINEIRSPYSGVVKNIHVNNGQLVGFEQPLFDLEKADV